MIMIAHQNQRDQVRKTGLSTNIEKSTQLKLKGKDSWPENIQNKKSNFKFKINVNKIVRSIPTRSMFFTWKIISVIISHFFS